MTLIKCKKITENELLRLITNNPKLHKAYEDFVDRELCKIIMVHRELLDGFDYTLRIGNVFVNYVKYETYNMWTTLSEYQCVVDKIKQVCDLDWVYAYGLDRCIKLSNKNSNLLFHYAEILIKEFSDAMSELCDDFESQICAISEKELDEIPTGYLGEFIKTKNFGKGKIEIC